MIDDNDDDDEDEEEEEEEGNELEAPPSPSASPIPSPALEETQKHRPTTLNLTAPGTQVSLGGRRCPLPTPGVTVPFPLLSLSLSPLVVTVPSPPRFSVPRAHPHPVSPLFPHSGLPPGMSPQGCPRVPAHAPPQCVGSRRSRRRCQGTAGPSGISGPPRFPRAAGLGGLPGGWRSPRGDTAQGPAPLLCHPREGRGEPLDPPHRGSREEAMSWSSVPVSPHPLSLSLPAPFTCPPRTCPSSLSPAAPVPKPITHCHPLPSLSPHPCPLQHPFPFPIPISHIPHSHLPVPVPVPSVPPQSPSGPSRLVPAGSGRAP